MGPSGDVGVANDFPTHISAFKFMTNTYVCMVGNINFILL
jgi:hypothetical protein